MARERYVCMRSYCWPSMLSNSLDFESPSLSLSAWTVVVISATPNWLASSSCPHRILFAKPSPRCRCAGGSCIDTTDSVSDLAREDLSLVFWYTLLFFSPYVPRFRQLVAAVNTAFSFPCIRPYSQQLSTQPNLCRVPLCSPDLASFVDEERASPYLFRMLNHVAAMSLADVAHGHGPTFFYNLTNSGPENTSQRRKPWHTTCRSGESWRGSPSWRAPTAPRGTKGPIQGKASNE